MSNEHEAPPDDRWWPLWAALVVIGLMLSFVVLYVYCPRHQ